MNNMYDILAKINLLEGKSSKPDFLDLDKDGDTGETMKQASQQAKQVKEGDGEFTQADYDKIARKKRHLMMLNRNLEPEDAEEMAAQKLGYDYDAVLAWVNADHDEVKEGSTGDYSAKKARAGKDIGKPGKQFGKIAADAAKRYGSKERGEKVAGAVLAKLRTKESIGEGDDIQEPRNPQELDYQQGPEDDAQYRRHHGLDDPDRARERRLRATDYKTLDRLERQAVDRAKQMDEDDIDEVSRGEYIRQQDAKAEKSGKEKFMAFGQKFDTDEVKEYKQKSIKLVKEARQDDRSVKIYHDRTYDEFTVCLQDASDMQRVFAENREQALAYAQQWLQEGRNDPSPLDDPLTRFRKKHAPSVMRDPKGREEVSKLDVEYGERKKTAYGRGEEEDEDDEDGKKKTKPAGEKRGRGRPKGTKRRIGAKGPTGRSKLLTREDQQDMADGTQTWGVYYQFGGDNNWTLIGTTEAASEKEARQNAYHYPKKLKLTPEMQRDEQRKRDNRIPGFWSRSGGGPGPLLVKMLNNQQDVAEDYDRDEYDEEGEMAKSQARTIEDAARELQDILDDDENLPEWVQKKIVLAKEYIDSARDYMKANPEEEAEEVEVEVDDEMIPERELTKPEMKKREEIVKSMKKDKAGFEKRYGKRGEDVMYATATKQAKKTAEAKDQEPVEETTVAGSVAVSDEAPKNKKGGMQFGKGVYEGRLEESFNRKFAQILSEGTTITINDPDTGEPSVTVNATGEDAAGLGELLKLAGMFSSSGYTKVDAQDTCSVCGGAGMHEAGCSARVMEEDLANSANNTETMDTDYMTQDLAGGLNGPKLQSNPNNMGDNPLAMQNLGTKASPNLNLGAVAEEIDQERKNNLIELYKRIA